MYEGSNFPQGKHLKVSFSNSKGNLRKTVAIYGPPNLYLVNLKTLLWLWHFEMISAGLSPVVASK